MGPATATGGLQRAGTSGRRAQTCSSTHPVVGAEAPPCHNLPCGPVSPRGVPESGRWPECIELHPDSSRAASARAGSHLLERGGGWEGVGRGMQQGQVPPARLRGGRRVGPRRVESVCGGKKSELGAAILTPCPSSGSAPGWLCDLKRKTHSSPSLLSPPLESEASKGKAHKPRRPCQGGDPMPAPGDSAACCTDRERECEAILPRGGRPAQHPQAQHPQRRQRQGPRVAGSGEGEGAAGCQGPWTQGSVTVLRPQPSCSPTPATSCRPAKQRAHSNSRGVWM